MILSCAASLRTRRLVLAALAVSFLASTESKGDGPAMPPRPQASGVRGGLLVVVGARPDAVAMAIAAVRSGPFLGRSSTQTPPLSSGPSKQLPNKGSMAWCRWTGWTGGASSPTPRIW